MTYPRCPVSASFNRLSTSAICSSTWWVWVTNWLVLASPLMLRYATAPITANIKNASANPAAIFRPNVHMSSLLRNAVVTAASLNRFSDERNTDDCANHVRRPHHMLNVRASYVLLLGRVKLGQ